MIYAGKTRRLFSDINLYAVTIIRMDTPISVIERKCLFSVFAIRGRRYAGDYGRRRFAWISTVWKNGRGV